jgi:hypothetical protein
MVGISTLNMSCGVASRAKCIVNDFDIVKERGEKCLITWNNKEQNRQPESDEVRNSSIVYSISTISERTATCLSCFEMGEAGCRL